MDINVLISEEELQKKIAELGATIRKDYDGKEILLVCVLRGSIMFAADLSRHLDAATTELEFIEASSYGDGTVSSGNIRITKDIGCDIKGKNILIVEDIIDTGLTLSFIIEHLAKKEPKSLKVCTLLDKPTRRKVNNINVDYCGFVIPNEFVVGYGLDFGQKYRNLNFIGFIENGGA